MESGTLPPPVPAPATQSTQPPALPPPAPSRSPDTLEIEQRRTIIIAIVVVVVLVVGMIIWIGYLALPTTDTARIRDIFIIMMALESLLIGLALVILMIQLARLINLLENDIKPILESTNETISHLRGTTAFLSDNLTEPVIKMNEYLAGLTQLLQALGLTRKRPKA